jgi:hypothetical protein
MTLIDRYIGRQVLSTSIFAVAVLSFVLVLGNIFRKLFELVINRALPLEFILSFIGYVLPFSLTFTIPWGFLTAILLLFGRLSAENELTAFRANGVPVTRLCYPIAGLALIFTLICLWINLEVAPRAQERMKATLFNIVTSNPIALFESDSVIEEFPGPQDLRRAKVGQRPGECPRVRAQRTGCPDAGHPRPSGTAGGGGSGGIGKRDHRRRPRRKAGPPPVVRRPVRAARRHRPRRSPQDEPRHHDGRGRHRHFHSRSFTRRTANAADQARCRSRNC